MPQGKQKMSTKLSNSDKAEHYSTFAVKSREKTHRDRPCSVVFQNPKQKTGASSTEAPVN